MKSKYLSLQNWIDITVILFPLSNEKGQVNVSQKKRSQLVTLSMVKVEHLPSVMPLVINVS